MGGTPKGWRDQASKLRAQSISELTIDVRGADLHQRVRASERPAHLLAFGHALADDRNSRQLCEGGSDAKPRSVTLAIVDDRAAIRSDTRFAARQAAKSRGGEVVISSMGVKPSSGL